MHEKICHDALEINHELRKANLNFPSLNDFEIIKKINYKNHSGQAILKHVKPNTS